MKLVGWESFVSSKTGEKFYNIYCESPLKSQFCAGVSCSRHFMSADVWESFSTKNRISLGDNIHISHNQNGYVDLIIKL